MNEDEDNELLDQLLEQQIAQSGWCLDQWANIRQIHVITNKTEVIKHLCEMDSGLRDKFICQIIMGALDSRKMCNVVESKTQKKITGEILDKDILITEMKTLLLRLMVMHDEGAFSMLTSKFQEDMTDIIEHSKVLLDK